ncbi:MAG: hypothetical protein ACRC20_06435 [Segniliparus sp.]|uniref:hypothetical protein n=1 Tax=Segniliparus sp. TaxID=2804064 RepID=UPI003F343EC7
MSHTRKAGALAGILMGAAGLLVPLGSASPAAALPPEHYCPFTGIPSHGGCSMSGPTRIETVPSGTVSEPNQNPVKPNRRYEAGRLSNPNGNTDIHGASPGDSAGVAGGAPSGSRRL